MGKYFYVPSGRNFEIYEEEGTVNGVTFSRKVEGERIYRPNEREQAKKRVYELNGWKWKK